MPRPSKIIILALVILAASFLVQSCAPQPTLEGRWLSKGASGLLFDFRSDGSVWLIAENTTRPVWRYEISGKDRIQLYDGMGRKREYRFSLSTDSLVFYDLNNGAAAGEYTRGKP